MIAVCRLGLWAPTYFFVLRSSHIILITLSGIVVHFTGKKKTNWRAEIYFSPLARLRNGSDCFLVILFCSYFLKALQSDDDINTVYTHGRKF